MLIATGIVDTLPDAPDVPDMIAAGSLRLCPICDAYEVIDKRVAVIGPADQAAKKAVFLRTYSSDVTLLVTEPMSELDPAASELLNGAGVTVEECLPDSVRAEGHGALVSLPDGRTLSFDTIYPAMGCTMRSKLAIDLGAACDEVGNLVVDSHQRTGIAGLYAAGDVVDEINQIAVAFGHAAIAAVDMHNYLATTDRNRGALVRPKTVAVARAGPQHARLSGTFLRCVLVEHAIHDLVNGSADKMRTKGELPWQKKRRWKISSTIR